MIQKPKIQYIGQFYTHGSEARQLEQQQEQKKKSKTKLPIAQLERIEKVYIDPVALIGIAVALVMLVTMVIGATQLKTDWKSYEIMSDYLSRVKLKNAQLTQDYRSGYDLDEIASKAQALGLVPREDLTTTTITVTLPTPEPAYTWEDELRWFWNGLWE